METKHSTWRWIIVAGMLSGTVLGAQQAAVPPPTAMADTSSDRSSRPAKGAGPESIEVLSDTAGIDLQPYLNGVVQLVRKNWYALMPAKTGEPELQHGKVSIEFRVLKDGKITGIRLTEPSGDAVLDRVAWGSLQASSPLPPLPVALQTPDLALRLHFQYNPQGPAVAPASAETSASAPDRQGTQVFKIGNGVTAPRVISHSDPTHTERAHKAKEQGSVKLWVLLGADGLIHDAKVVQGLSPDLDAKAIEAVRSWKFEPATKDGKPVAVTFNVVVNFKLY